MDHGDRDLVSGNQAEEVQEGKTEEEEARRRRPKARRRPLAPEGRQASRQGVEEEGEQVERLAPLEDAKRLLHEVHAKTGKVIVGLSGGKDSLVTLDLAVREFGSANVSCFFMYLVKGLRCVETGIRWCERRYKVEVLRFPHWRLGLAYKYATYMPHRHGADEWRDMRQVDIEQAARAKTGHEWLAYGHRMADSIERVGMLSKISGFDLVGRRVYPLWRWNEAAVVSYLRARKIPMPPKLTILKRSMTGVNFQEDTLLAIRERYPDDYARIVEVFPYLPAKLARFEMKKTSWKQETYVDKWKTSLRGR